MTSVTEDKVKLCTSESYDFLDIHAAKDRDSVFLEIVVAVVDGCRQMSNACDREELTFLSNLSGLDDYKAVIKICDNCPTMNVCEALNIEINGHEFFCASIIISQIIHGAYVRELFLGDVSGISPPPKIAVYVIGCPSKMTEEDMIYDIKASIQTKVSLISMSLARSPTFMSDWSSADFHGKDLASLDALEAGIAIVVSAGNLGTNHLKYIAKAALWCLTIASCTSKSKFMSTSTFKSDSARINSFQIQVKSSYVFQENEWIKLRREGNIEDSSCMMYFDSPLEDFVIREGSIDNECALSLLFVLYLSEEQSAIIYKRLDIEDLLVQIKSARIAITNTPLVSTFSSRGSCTYYKEIMKLDLCAPGEMIAASWSIDVPLKGVDLFQPDICAHGEMIVVSWRTDVPLKGVDCYVVSEFSVLSGTSFAVPQVAIAIALLRAKTNFSATEVISAVIIQDKVELCTSESYDFLDICIDKYRSDAFLEIFVAVVDGCRYTSSVCDREELTFLSNLS